MPIMRLLTLVILLLSDASAVDTLRDPLLRKKGKSASDGSVSSKAKRGASKGMGRRKGGKSSSQNKCQTPSNEISVNTLDAETQAIIAPSVVALPAQCVQDFVTIDGVVYSLEALVPCEDPLIVGQEGEILPERRRRNVRKLREVTKKSKGAKSSKKGKGSSQEDDADDLVGSCLEGFINGANVTIYLDVDKEIIIEGAVQPLGQEEIFFVATGNAANEVVTVRSSDLCPCFFDQWDLEEPVSLCPTDAPEPMYPTASFIPYPTPSLEPYPSGSGDAYPTLSPYPTPTCDVDLYESEQSSSYRKLMQELNDIGAIEEEDEPPTSIVEERRLRTCNQRRTLNIAVFYDSSFCRAAGGSPRKANAWVKNVINKASQKYSQAPLCTQIKLAYVNGYCQPGSDPFRERPKDPSEARVFFRDWWNRNWKGNALLQSRLGNIELGVKHLFTGTGFSRSIIGVAEEGSLCSEDEGFGIEYVFYTKQIFVQSVLVQHEIGHNIGARHLESVDDNAVACRTSPSRNIMCAKPADPNAQFSDITVQVLERGLERAGWCL